MKGLSGAQHGGLSGKSIVREGSGGFSWLGGVGIGVRVSGGCATCGNRSSAMVTDQAPCLDFDLPLPVIYYGFYRSKRHPYRTMYALTLDPSLMAVLKVVH
jgi:hypothetical protein